MNTTNTVVLVAIDLQGAELDYFVARAMGIENVMIVRDLNTCVSPHLGRMFNGQTCHDAYRPSGDWSHCGQIIEELRIAIFPCISGGWIAKRGKLVSGGGNTPMQAACRLVVAETFGESFRAEMIVEGNKETYKFL